MAVDKVKLHQFLIDQGRVLGRRCESACNNTQGDIIAAAIAMNCMYYLMHAAEIKLLTSADIEVLMDAFADAAGIREELTPMGTPVYVRNSQP